MINHAPLLLDTLPANPQLALERVLDRSARQLLVEAAFAAANQGYRQEAEAMFGMLTWVIDDHRQREFCRSVLLFALGNVSGAQSCLTNMDDESEEVSALRELMQQAFAEVAAHGNNICY